MTIWRVEVYRDDQRQILIQSDSIGKIIRTMFRELIRGKRV